MPFPIRARPAVHAAVRSAVPSVALAAALALVSTGRAAPEPSNPEPPHAALTPEIADDQLATRAAFLASDDLQGRESGTPGGRAAEDYVASELARFGLEPASPAKGFQDVPLPWRPVLPAESWLEIRTDGEDAVRRTPLEGAVPFSRSAPGEGAAGVVFAGYGISSPEDRYDDWAGLDAKGRIAIVLRHGPREDAKESPWYLRKADQARLLQMSFETKAKRAAEAGAIAVLFVNDQFHKDQALPTTSPGDAMAIPAIAVSRADANRILRGAGKELADFESAIGRDLQPRSCEVPGVTVAFRSALGDATGRNVLFARKGSDPKLADEVIVVSAHMDHVGLGWFGSTSGAAGRGQIHNGADDNGSGTAAMLEVAESLAAGPALRRTVLFAGWCGEEKGLIGSAYWADHPTVPMASVAANVNLDMVGRYRDSGDDEKGLQVVGAPTGSGFMDLVDGIAKSHSVRVTHTWEAWEQSDHFSLYRKKVPVLFLHTGLHPDYHKPGDDWWKLDSKDAARVARLTADLVRRLADADARPEFREKPRRAVLGVNLGDEDDGGGARLGTIYPGLGAAKAGLKEKDVIVEAAGQKIRSSADLLRLLATRQPGEEIDVVFLRGKERLAAKVTLSAR